MTIPSRSCSYKHDFAIPSSSDSYFQRQTQNSLSPNRFNPLPHDSQAWKLLLASLVAGAQEGLPPQMNYMPVVPRKS